MSHAHANLVRSILKDLALALPEDFTYDLSVQGEGLVIGFSSAGLSAAGWVRLDDSRCEVARKLLSDLQDFMADAHGEWWPMLGRQRLDYVVDCHNDRPRLMFTLAR